VVSAAALLGTAITATAARAEAWIPWTLGGVGAAFTLALVADLFLGRRRP
jgi:hypothetical protein